MHIVLTGVKGVRWRCETKKKNWDWGKEMPDFFPPSLLTSPLSWCYPFILCLIFNLVFSSYPPDRLASLAHIYSTVFYTLHSLHLCCCEGWVTVSSCLSPILGFRDDSGICGTLPAKPRAVSRKADSIISDVLMSNSSYKSASQGDETCLWAVIVSMHKAQCCICNH